MNNKSVKDQVIACIAECFSIPKHVIDSNFSQDTYSAWDSLAHLKLLMLLEEKLDITFAGEDIAQMSSLNDVISIVTAKRKKRNVN